MCECMIFSEESTHFGLILMLGRVGGGEGGVSGSAWAQVGRAGREWELAGV